MEELPIKTTAKEILGECQEGYTHELEDFNKEHFRGGYIVLECSKCGKEINQEELQKAYILKKLEKV